MVDCWRDNSVTLQVKVTHIHLSHDILREFSLFVVIPQIFQLIDLYVSRSLMEVTR